MIMIIIKIPTIREIFTLIQILSTALFRIVISYFDRGDWVKGVQKSEPLTNLKTFVVIVFAHLHCALISHAMSCVEARTK